MLEPGKDGMNQGRKYLKAAEDMMKSESLHGLIP
jgi:hypothetical protein